MFYMRMEVADISACLKNALLEFVIENCPNKIVQHDLIIKPCSSMDDRWIRLQICKGTKSARDGTATFTLRSVNVRHLVIGFISQDDIYVIPSQSTAGNTKLRITVANDHPQRATSISHIALIISNIYNDIDSNMSFAKCDVISYVRKYSKPAMRMRIYPSATLSK